MITRVQHFSFTVSNLEEAVRFFHDLLGLEATPVREAKGERVEKLIGIPGAWLRVVMIITPDNSCLELIEYAAPKGKKVDLSTCNTGVAHLALEVDDLQKAYDELTAKGVKFNYPPQWSEGGALKGWGICYLKGPDGITLEFMERPKGVELHPATGYQLQY